MAQIFHRSTNTLSKFSIFGALFAVGGALWLTMEITRSPYVTNQGIQRDQPVPFSHQHHAGGIGIDCRYCHTSVETESYAELNNGRIYNNLYHFLFVVKDGKIHRVKEFLDTDHTAAIFLAP